MWDSVKTGLWTAWTLDCMDSGLDSGPHSGLEYGLQFVAQAAEFEF